MSVREDRVENEFHPLYVSRLSHGARNLGKLETTLRVVSRVEVREGLREGGYGLRALRIEGFNSQSTGC